MGFRIKTVAELTGIPRETLIAWERRYGLVAPKRQPNGFREYDESDVALLQELKRLVDRGHAPSEAVSMLQGRGSVPPASTAAPASGLEDARKRAQAALLAYDRSAADREASVLSGVSYDQQLHAFYYPILREVGTLWEQGAVTIAQEHHASAWCRDRIVAMMQQISTHQHGPVVMIACYPGDRHEIGPLGLALQLALHGHRLIWLGADVPLADLCEAVREKTPDIVCVSATLEPQVDALVAYARRLRAAAPSRTRVAIGGQGIRSGYLPEIPGVDWEYLRKGM
jgi:DNA-binding transcriptional MerR regulator